MRAQNAYDQVMTTLRDMNAFAKANGWSITSQQVSEAFGIANREFAIKHANFICFDAEIEVGADGASDN